MKKIDIYNHVLPMRYLELVKAHSKDAGMVKRMSSLRMLWDMEARAEMLAQKFPDVLQVLTLGQPAPEALGGPERSPEFARMANDDMADICRRWPERFPAFVAALPMNNVPAALEEMDRAIGDLGARGIQIVTNVNGRPLDEPEFLPIFENITRKHDLPVWMHPFRPGNTADYKGEERSKYEIWQVLGWPFETSVAMARMVFSGCWSDCLIYASSRITAAECCPTSRAAPRPCGLSSAAAAQMAARPMCSKSYPSRRWTISVCSTAIRCLAAPPLRCVVDWNFSVQTTWCSRPTVPFDPEGGPMFIREGIRSIEEVDLSDADREKLYLGNALRLMRMQHIKG